MNGIKITHFNALVMLNIKLFAVRGILLDHFKNKPAKFELSGSKVTFVMFQATV